MVRYLPRNVVSKFDIRHYVFRHKTRNVIEIRQYVIKDEMLNKTKTWLSAGKFLYYILFLPYHELRILYDRIKHCFTCSMISVNMILKYMILLQSWGTWITKSFNRKLQNIGFYIKWKYGFHAMLLVNGIWYSMHNKKNVTISFLFLFFMERNERKRMLGEIRFSWKILPQIDWTKNRILYEFTKNFTNLRERFNKFLTRIDLR